VAVVGAVVVLALAGAGAGATVAVTASGSGRSEEAALRTDVPTVRRMLERRLDEKLLNVRYVACVRSPARLEGGPVVRCNVNFNAPHIEVYCGVVHDGVLLTDHDSTAVPCPRDDRGANPPITVNGG
jgi:hypothetical protein